MLAVAMTCAPRVFEELDGGSRRRDTVTSKTVQTSPAVRESAPWRTGEVAGGEAHRPRPRSVEPAHIFKTVRGGSAPKVLSRSSAHDVAQHDLAPAVRATQSA
jgi:hypothetical protein